MESLRRISATLFALGVLVAGITLLANYAVSCPLGTSCLGAVFSYEDGVNIYSSATQVSTDPVVPELSQISDFSILNQIINSVSIYLLLITGIILLVLEIKELHYLKELSLMRRRKKLKA